MSLFSPALILSVVLASLYAAVFHLLWAPRQGKLWVYWLAALVGFGLGQLLARFSPVRLILIGNVHVVEATIAAAAALVIAKRVKL